MMQETEIRGLAAARGQFYTKCLVRGKPVYLLHDTNPCSLDDLAGSLDTDSYEDYVSGKFQVEVVGTHRKSDVQGDEVLDWTNHMVFFNEKKGLTKRQRRILKMFKEGATAQVAASNKAYLFNNKSSMIATVLQDTLQTLEEQGCIVRDQCGTWTLAEKAEWA